jgi:hypothetical protein
VHRDTLVQRRRHADIETAVGASNHIRPIRFHACKSQHRVPPPSPALRQAQGDRTLRQAQGDGVLHRLRVTEIGLEPLPLGRGREYILRRKCGECDMIRRKGACGRSVYLGARPLAAL